MGKVTLLVSLNILICLHINAAVDNDCHSVYVRLPRAALDQTARVSGPYDLKECQDACSKDKHPANAKFKFECAAFNHRKGFNAFSNDCQLYTKDQLADLDHDLVARDQYSFYKKLCVPSKKICKSVFEYELVMDSYMERSEVETTVPTKTVEECLAVCLDEKKFTCRSASYNRTGNLCLLSTHNRISKPGYVRVNSLPEFRIDYYENNCYNDSFSFSTECKSDGILVTVEAQFDYDGAIYGLYDYFTCRYEPKKEKKFSFFFPLPKVAKNCSASMYYQDGDIIADVILSTDGVEPLYFTTDQDVLYHARCKAPQIDSDNKVSATVATNIDIEPGKVTKQSETDKQTNNGKTTATPVWWLFSGTSNSTAASNVTQNITNSTASAFALATTTIGPSFILATLFSESSRTESKRRNLSDSNNNYNFSITTVATTVTSNAAQTAYTDTLVGSTVKSGGPYKTILIGNIFSNQTDFASSIDAVPYDTAAKSLQSAISSTSTLPTNSEIFSTVATANPTRNYTVVNTTVTIVSRTNNLTNVHSTRIPTTTTTETVSTSKSTDFWWKSQERTTEKPWWRLPDYTTNATFLPKMTTSTISSTIADVTTSNLTTASTTSSTAAQTTTPSTTTKLSTTTSSVTSTLTTAIATDRTTPNTTARNIYTTTAVPQDIKFDVLFNNVPTQAVLIQSLITLSFSPGSTITADPTQMALLSCKVEAVGSRYFLEPLVLVEKGCPSDGVGLVYPVRKTKNGLAVEMESFRFTDSSEVLYTCVVRVCQGQCASFPCFDAGGNPYVSNGRKKRQLNIGVSYKDYTVQKKLVVFNNQYDFQYYLRTGRVPLVQQQSDDNRFGG